MVGQNPFEPESPCPGQSEAIKISDGQRVVSNNYYPLSYIRMKVSAETVLRDSDTDHGRKHGYAPGLPDGLFSNQKSQFW
jgi:hypothetical protein